MPDISDKAKPIVLYVDDEPQALKYFEKALSNDVRILTAQSADQAEEILKDQGAEIAVLVSDHRMPARTGASLMAAVRLTHPNIVRILTTAYSEIEGAIEAVNRGEVFRYILKPWAFEALRQDVLTAVQVNRLHVDRDLLLAEKFSVRQRLIALDRAKALLLAGCALSSLPKASNAMYAYVRDAAKISFPNDLKVKCNLDLWSEAEAELTYMQKIIKEIDCLHPEMISQPSSSVALESRWADAALDRMLGQVLCSRIDLMKLEAKGDAGSVAKTILKALMSASTLWLDNLSVKQINQQAGVDASVLSFTINGNVRGDRPDDLLFAPTEGADIEDRTKLIGAYLLVYELGGNISLQRDEHNLSLLLQMADAKPPVAPSEIFDLNSLFKGFENWG